MGEFIQAVLEQIHRCTNALSRLQAVRVVPRHGLFVFALVAQFIPISLLWLYYSHRFSWIEFGAAPITKIRDSCFTNSAIRAT